MHSKEIWATSNRRASERFIKPVCECVRAFGSISLLNRIISIISNNMFCVEREQSCADTHAHTHHTEAEVTHGQG